MEGMIAVEDIDALRGIPGNPLRAEQSLFFCKLVAKGDHTYESVKLGSIPHLIVNGPVVVGNGCWNVPLQTHCHGLITRPRVWALSVGTYHSFAHLIGLVCCASG